MDEKIVERFNQEMQRIGGYEIRRLKEHAEELLEKSCSIVLCGATPFAQKVVENKECIGTKNIFILDDLTQVEKYNKQDTLFVLCSRPRIASHLELLCKAGITKIMQYQILLALYPQFGTEPYAYQFDKIEKQIEDISVHKDEYLHILDGLSDERSKEIFMKIILFRLTYDYHLHFNSATKYAHYFEEDIFSVGTKEIFVDGGGYIGDTLEQFKKITENRYEEYHLFEPDKELISKIQINDKRVILHNSGLWKHAGELTFCLQTAAGNGKLVEGIPDRGMVHVPVVAIDEVVNKATFIKLDVEGSELCALKGARNVIARCNPKLAVCTYHKYDDLRELYDEISQYGVYDIYLRAEMNNVDTEHYYICIPQI